MCVAAPEGRVSVVDGDTIRVGGQIVRLHGIDAPERDQTCRRDGRPWNCGAWSTGQLRARFGGRRAVCETFERDRYGRSVARCRVEGRDIGRSLVADGVAFAYRRYAMDYDPTERAARRAGRGLWSADVTQPHLHRKRRAQAAARASARQAPPGCAIKGNISSGRERIYHMPDQRDYGRTRISTTKGERWFCSEAAARAAGWRRAMR